MDLCPRLEEGFSFKVHHESPNFIGSLSITYMCESSESWAKTHVMMIRPLGIRRNNIDVRIYAPNAFHHQSLPKMRPLQDISLEEERSNVLSKYIYTLSVCETIPV